MSFHRTTKLASLLTLFALTFLLFTTGCGVNDQKDKTQVKEVYLAHCKHRNECSIKITGSPNPDDKKCRDEAEEIEGKFDKFLCPDAIKKEFIKRYIDAYTCYSKADCEQLGLSCVTEIEAMIKQQTDHPECR